MTTIRESGFVLKIATGQAIGVTDESLLDPANMSSGSATAGQVATADGAGGVSWSTESGLGDVSGPAGATDNAVAVFDGTGGKTIKAPNAAVDFKGQQASNLDQSNLTPASMSSGAATSGQLLTAGGGGATSWQDPPASVNLPGSSTDNALTRWDGAGADTVADSVVTLSDTGDMVFPAGGSVSKPGAGAGSEVFGTGSTAAGSNAVAVGNGVAVASNDATAVGASVDIGASCVGAVAIGQNATVIEPNADDTSGAITIGKNSRIGEASQAGSLAAVCVGEAATIGFNADNGICMGAAATIGDNCQNTVVLGPSASVVDGVAQSVVVGRGANIFDAAGDQSVIVGDAANGDAGLQTAVGGSVSVRSTRATGVGYGVIANGDSCTALGTAARIDSHADAVCIGPSARINAASSGDSAACILIGHNASVSAGAGVDASVGIGESATIVAGSTRSIAIGRSAATRSPYSVAIGEDADSNAGHDNAIAMGRAAQTTAANRATFGTIGGSHDLELQCGKGLGVFGVTPPASQPTKISDPTGGATIDSESRTAINAIIDALEGVGITAAV